MAVLTNSGRAGLAAALKSRPMFVAWGTGASWWGATSVENKSFAGTPQKITLDHAPVSSLIVSDPSGTPVYAKPADYDYDPVTGVITAVNGGAIPADEAVRATAVYGTPALSASETALVAEVGRREAASVEFVVPDESGVISTPGGERWTISVTPTRYLYVQVLFDYLEAVGETIREVGVFVDTTRASGVPEGQLYLTPEEIEDQGYLLLLDRFAGITRSSDARNGFSYVLVI